MDWKTARHVKTDELKEAIWSKTVIKVSTDWGGVVLYRSYDGEFLGLYKEEYLWHEFLESLLLIRYRDSDFVIDDDDEVCATLEDLDRAEAEHDAKLAKIAELEAEIKSLKGLEAEIKSLKGADD